MSIRVPKITHAACVSLLRANSVDIDKEGVALLAVRGYYRDSEGKPGVNDRRVWDDIIVIVLRDQVFRYQANVDPSIYQFRVASLVPGVYEIVKHLHKGRYASFQIVRDVVRRDGVEGVDIGRHGINIHYDSEHLPTGSLGCLTLRKSQYWPFQKRLYSYFAKFDKQTVKLVLIEND